MYSGSGLANFLSFAYGTAVITIRKNGTDLNMRSTLILTCATCLAISLGCHADETNVVKINADVWADNWFALYAGDTLIKQDSVPYYTEKSFNSESFSFDITLPATLSVIMKDFKENDTGLEYIGSSRQQIGDGGFAAQFMDAATGDLLLVSNGNWRCISIHQAPTNKSCEHSSDPENECASTMQPEPDNWKNTDFDDSAWSETVVHPSQAVRPHGGYSSVSWRSDTKLIWTADLEMDNTVLCRVTIPAPE